MTKMLTMDNLLDRENNAIMMYCDDLFNEWRTRNIPNKAVMNDMIKRRRFAQLERIAECQRIDNALAKSIDPYEADLRTRVWAIRIGC